MFDDLSAINPGTMVVVEVEGSRMGFAGRHHYILLSLPLYNVKQTIW